MPDDIINPLFEALADPDDDDGTLEPTNPAPIPPVDPPATDPEPPAAPVTPAAPATPQQPSANPSVQAFQMSRAATRVERELREEFGDLLSTDDIERITEHIAVNSDPAAFINQVDEGIHKEYAKTVAFDKLKERQKQGVSDPTPVGSQSPVRTGQEGTATIVSDFERMYGKPSKAQADRLSREARQ